MNFIASNANTWLRWLTDDLESDEAALRHMSKYDQNSSCFFVAIALKGLVWGNFQACKLVNLGNLNFLDLWKFPIRWRMHVIQLLLKTRASIILIDVALPYRTPLMSSQPTKLGMRDVKRHTLSYFITPSLHFLTL